MSTKPCDRHVKGQRKKIYRWNSLLAALNFLARKFTWRGSKKARVVPNLRKTSVVKELKEQAENGKLINHPELLIERRGQAFCHAYDSLYIFPDV
ncbi:hypothetical protein PoB_000934700 [Plakobranchus ocellatus]|uniref:Uncharacterized protein n=1 Tax=Plakobranchus ocellatus TaxID=259542 RepID=A0AAV3YKC1_9GAST|nr:hypothetical protein PoB_000934700 [Plakobranchus ocellatus]